MPVRSPYPDVEIPGVDLETFLFGRDLGEHADVPAFVDGTTGASLTFGELHEQVLRIAAALAQRGIGRGDVVALYAPNSPAWAAVFHGVLRANATLTSVNALYTAGELAAQLADSRARMVVTTAALLERAESAAKEVGLDDDADRRAGRRASGHACVDDLLACHRRAARTGGRARRPGRAALLLGHHRPAEGRDPHPPQPRGEPAAAAARSSQVEPGHADPRRAAVLPHLRHDVMMNHGHPPAGHRRHPAPVRPGRVPAGDRRVPGPAGLHRVPPIAVALAKHPIVDSYDLSSRRDRSSPAPHRWTPSSRRRSARRLGCRVVQGYGMTEMSPVSHCDAGRPARPGRHQRRLALPNMEAMLVDPETGAELPAGRARRAVVPRPERHGRLPERPRGHRRHPRRRRLAAHRGPRHRRPRTACSRSSTGSRS